MREALAIALAAVSMLLPRAGGAETAREILDEVIAKNRAREPKDLTQLVRMANFQGETQIFARELETSTKFYPDDTTKVLTRFLAPADIKDVGFLAWNDPHRDDVQWLYLPKLGRVRQIGARQRRASFQDTVFSYEDLELFAEMTEWTEADARSELRSEREVLEEAPCVVIELVPARADVSYGRFLLWIHRPDATLRKTELYDRADGKLAKTARFSRFRVTDGLPIATAVEAADVRSGLRTVLEIAETRIDQGLDEELFTPWHMERAGP